MRPQCPLLFPLYYSNKSYTKNLQAQQLNSITYITLITIEQVHCISSLMSVNVCMKRYNECARLLLVFCKLLRRVVAREDPLYNFCRNSIREIVEAIGITRCKKNVANEFLALNDAFMFACEFEVDDLSVIIFF